MTQTWLTPHFALEEFLISQTAARRGIANVPSDSSKKHIQRIAETMEKVRSVLDNHPVMINSGYRSPKLNEAVGGVKGSAHTHGLAADFICPSFGDPLEICQALESKLAEFDVDQLIMEYGTWVHLGLRDSKPRHQCLTIDRRGARSGFT